MVWNGRVEEVSGGGNNVIKISKNILKKTSEQSRYLVWTLSSKIVKGLQEDRCVM